MCADVAVKIKAAELEAPEVVEIGNDIKNIKCKNSVNLAVNLKGCVKAILDTV